MDDLSRFVPNVHFEQIPIKNLVSNQDYQRDLSQTHIAKASANFDLYQINPVKVSRRDGINYVFNGQHTIEIVAAVSGSRETPVWCMIYDDLSYEHEADIFANQQKFTKALTPYEIFAANIEAGNEEQLMIRDLVESFNLQISGKKAPGYICAVSTIESIYRKFGYQTLSRTLRLIIGAWEGDMDSFSGNFLNGVARMIVAYGNQLKDELFKEKLGAVSVKSISRTAKDRRNGSIGYAEAMVLIYNGRKKGNAFKLPMNKLYTKENLTGDEEEDYGDYDEQDMEDDFEGEQFELDDTVDEDGSDEGGS